MKKFWNWIRNEDGERVLRLEGPIDEDDFWGDAITPKAFRDELEAEEGDVTVWVNSPGGNVFAAAEIYTMLCDHKGKITVKIDAIAASAASVIAMAGDRVLMSPISLMMVHDPMTMAMGNARDMEKAITTLNEVKESIINAYQRKTGLRRSKISELMENETWMNAKKAVEYGFADEILFAKDHVDPGREEEDNDSDEKEIAVRASLKEWQPYSTRIMGQTVLNRFRGATGLSAGPEEASVDATAEAEDMEPAEAGVKAIMSGEEGTMSDKGDPVKDDDTEGPDDPDEEAHNDDSGENLKEKPRHSNETLGDSLPKGPVIGLDGKTDDGSMPYELLMKQLEFLR